jgi:uncharacterized iron-regulated protein
MQLRRAHRWPRGSGRPHPLTAALAVALVGGLASCSASGPAMTRPQNGLVGRIYDVASDAFISEQDLAARLVGPRFVLLGEQHDNPDHHLLQARVIQLLLASGSRPTVAFEMFATDRAGAIKDCLAPPVCSVDEFRYAVEWDASGWPPWQLYEPIFKTVIGARLPIVAADIPSYAMKLLVSSSTQQAAERAAWIAWLGIERPMDQKERQELTEEIRKSHCDLLPEEIVPGMVRGQRARDAHLAKMIEQAASGGEGPVVLIAGSGHTRLDRGVPTYFVAPHARESTLSIAFIEAKAKYPSPRDYVRRFGGDLPFDILWFTERVEREDPCKVNRERLEEIGGKSSSNRSR